MPGYNRHLLADPRFRGAPARGGFRFDARTPLIRPGFLGQAPVAQREPFRGPDHTLEAMADTILGPNGEQSARVRQFTEQVVRFVFPKDYLAEILAIRNVFVQFSPRIPGTPLIRYTNDPAHVELIKTPDRMVREIEQHGTCLCDCDESAVLAATMCLQVGRKVTLVAMGFAPNSLSHVAMVVTEPKSGVPVLLDGVAGPREAEAAGAAKAIRFYSLD